MDTTLVVLDDVLGDEGFRVFQLRTSAGDVDFTGNPLIVINQQEVVIRAVDGRVSVIVRDRA